ncbi:hypothetical protein MKR77_004335 [Escherichia coli]|nr:hypothetical protein [Escherichia coli]EIX6042921.1 hypothetical protein [Escherichia coli]
MGQISTDNILHPDSAAPDTPREQGMEIRMFLKQRQTGKSHRIPEVHRRWFICNKLSDQTFRQHGHLWPDL